MKKLSLILMLAICMTAYGVEQQRDSVTVNKVKTEKVSKKGKKEKKPSKKEQMKQLMKKEKPTYVEPSAEDRKRDSIAGTTKTKLY